MIRESWFASPIWFDYLDLDLKPIANKCIELKENDFPNRNYTNRGGWQSVDINLNTFSEFKILNQKLQSKISILAQEVDDELKLEIDNAWININEKGNYNDKHVHSLTAFSGVVYIQVDNNTGDIRFFDDLFTIKHYPLKISPYNKLFHHTVTYKPKNGLVMMFPAWIPHDVTPSESNLTRVSISFNIKQTI